MENMNFIPRDDVYAKKNSATKLKLSSESLRINQPSEHEESLSNESSDHLEKQINDEKKTAQESIETVFEKLRVDEDKTESITDSTFTSVAEKIYEKQNLETTQLQFEVRDPLPVPLSKEDLTKSFSTLESTSNIYLAEDFETSRSHRRRTNLSNIFPAGIMGCRDEYAQKTFTPRKLLSSQENVEKTNQTSRVSDIRKEIKEVTEVKQPIETKEIKAKEIKIAEEIKHTEQVKEEVKEITEVKHDREVKEEVVEDTRRRMIRRKDGNPLLGVGYEDTPPMFSTTACKVPPGGFSHRLW